MLKNLLLLIFSGTIVVLIRFLSASSIAEEKQFSQDVSLTPIQPSPTPVSILVSSVPKSSNEQRFEQIMQYAIAHNLANKSMDEMMQVLAKQFLGSQYKAGLLEQFDRETLVTSLTQFDCVLFVETVLALARGITVRDYNYSTFETHIIEQRYRHGEMDNYCSRLHYFSEWIDDNQRRGIVQNITSSLGGIPLNKQLNFMSTHRGSYPKLVNDEGSYQCIVEMEKNLSQLKMSYIPTQKIRQIYSELKSGDIIAVTTNIAGLDVTHTGLVYRQGNSVGLIHASPAGQVTIASDLQQYISKVPNSIGILIARPVAPLP